MTKLLKLMGSFTHSISIPAFTFILFYLLGAQAQAASISASPNPCTILAGQSTCTTSIAWSSSFLAEIWVSMDGGAKKLFACGVNSNSQSASWIQTGHNYVFNLYAAKNCSSSGLTGPVLNSVTVTAIKQPQPSLSANPNPCSISSGQSTCSVNLTWNNITLSEIWVSMNGQAAKLFACGNSGNQAASWIVAGNNYSFNIYNASNCSSSGAFGPVLNSVNVTANTYHVITATAGNNGTISPSGSVSVNYGASQTFTVTPHTGYNASLTVDGAAVTLTNNTYTLNDVETAHTVEATFSSITYTISASAGSNGSITPASATVSYGGSQTFTLMPHTGYSARLTVDGSAVTLSNNTYTLNDVTANHTLAASFLQTETINASAGTGGTIIPSGTVTVNYGANQTFSITPASGYSAELSVDGVNVALTNNTYTLSDVITSHTVIASFTVIGTAPSLSASPNPCTILAGQSTCTTSIAWSSGFLTEIWVSMDGQAPKLFACGVNSNNQSASWIQAGHTYAFNLYAANNCSAQGLTGPALKSVVVTAQSSPNPLAVFHSTYYHTVQASFWAQLADDTGPSPTPRQLAIASINNNFKAIRALGLDTVNFQLPDNDGWPSQHGGGFSYDPKRNGNPQFGVAQEIVVRIAAANNLKVIFTICLPAYRFSTDGRSAWNGLADEYGSTSNPQGAYYFIQSLIDPALYYGTISTTKLSTIGLQDGPIRSFIGDPRVIGWNFNAEWNPEVVNAQSKICTQEYGFKKYWNYFYNLVHWQGANNAFAGTYVIGSPTLNASNTIDHIKAMKQWFAPGSGIIAPDLIGIEFYGQPGYNFSNFYNDMTTEVEAMENADIGKYPGDFIIPANEIYLAEGNANVSGTSEPAMNQYFQDVFQVLADQGLAGINFFVSDTLADTTNKQNQWTLSPALPLFDLFTSSYTSTGTRTYAYDLPSGVGWHLTGTGANFSFADPTTYPVVYGMFPSSYGQWSYTGTTDIGTWLGQAIATHTNGVNLEFFANPNPVALSAGVTTLHWDLTKMPGVKTVQVRAGSITGAVLNNPVINGNSMNVPVTKSGYQNYVLVDTTNGANNLLGTVTLEVE